MHDNATEEIRSRINIEDLASEYLDLKRAGRNFKALSQFGTIFLLVRVVISSVLLWKSKD